MRHAQPQRRSEMESTRCRICGRLLTNPKSVERGIGPVCWARLKAGQIKEPEEAEADE